MSSGLAPQKRANRTSDSERYARAVANAKSFTAKYGEAVARALALGFSGSLARFQSTRQRAYVKVQMSKPGIPVYCMTGRGSIYDKGILDNIGYVLRFASKARDGIISAIYEHAALIQSPKANLPKILHCP